MNNPQVNSNECPDCRDLIKFGYLHLPGPCDLCGQTFFDVDWQALSHEKPREASRAYQLLKMRLAETACA